MKLKIISYTDLLDPANVIIGNEVKSALYNDGIIGVSHVPQFIEKTQAFIEAARKFSALEEEIKDQYAPKRDEGDTEGYELGAEWFKDENDNWQIDNKKASFYAFVPNHPKNKWPNEVDLKTPYLDLGKLIFATGKQVLHFLGINEVIGIHHDDIVGYGRMLHYQQESEAETTNPNWCGAHFDHSIFTGLAPAYYFRDGEEVEEPEESGLYIMPTSDKNFRKVYASDKSILLFQAGEFAQLAMHDNIRATQHLVKKAKSHIERFTFALFFSGNHNTVIHSQSELTKDARYAENKNADGSINFKKWHQASFARYRAKV